MLFDRYKDSLQVHPIKDEEVEALMIHKMKELMQLNEAPKEQYIRLGLIDNISTAL